MTETEWVTLTEHTPDPKLAWIERKLSEMGIPSRRGAWSAHFPALEIPREHLAQALKWMQSAFEADEPSIEAARTDEYERYASSGAREEEDDEQS
jgi:hypothetical protein